MNNHIKSLIMTLFLTALVILSTHYLHQPQPSKQASQATPNFYVWNANYITYNELGHRHGELQSPLTRHYLKNNTTTFTSPHIIIHTEKGTHWVIDAKQGQSQHGDQNIHLSNQVVVRQYPAEPKNPITLLKTNSLYIYPKQSKALSHQWVTITRDNMRASGIGLITNLKTGYSQLLSHSKGVFVPKPLQSK